MCGGNKGQSQQSQTQSYSPDPRAAGYITNALDRASATANLGFNVPVAPVAGFSNDQQSAFNTVRNAQGMAQPYFNQAADLYNQGATGSNISNFFNPYASAVTNNLKDIFGSQMSQTTGQLTQAAGGVGADRIAVGQSELAKQQGLAAGQTLASLYQPALQASQSAAFNGAQGLMGVGQGAQNAQLQGANAQMGTGGLQQQLAQAQMNAPYQWQVAQAAFPYQQSQFLSGAVGALAPGLGGTTAGQSTSTPPQPSIWSQLLGGAGAIAGGLGASGAFGSNGWMTGSNQTPIGATYGGYGSGSNGFGSMGGIQYPAYAEGGNVSDDPIDISANPFIPQTQLTPIKPNIPQLQQAPQGGSGGGGKGGGLGDVAKLAMMFINRGGRIPYAAGGSVSPFDVGQGFAFGGSPTDDERELGYDLLRRGMGVTAPESIPGGEPAPGQEPIRMPPPEAVQAWRDGVDQDRSRGVTNPAPDGLPTETALAYDATTGKPPTTSALPPEVLTGRSRQDAPQQQGNPYFAAVPQAPESAKTLADNPWMALMSAGLGIMGGTSPFAGVNIGQGGQQGLKMLQQQKENSQKDTTIAQAARRLEQEAKFHEDQYSRMTMGQKESQRQADLPYEKMTAAQKALDERQRDAAEDARKLAERPYNELTKAELARLEESRRQHDLARTPQGYKRDEQGNLVFEPGGPHDPATIKREMEAKRGPGMSDETLEPLVTSYMKGNTGVLAGVGRGTQGAQNLEKFWSMMATKLQQEGKTGADLASARANFMAQSAGMRVAAQREANIETAVNEAKGTFPEVLRTSQALPRSSFVPFNKVAEYVRTQTGSPEQRQYAAAIQAAVTAYSQAMSRTGANSVYAQQHAAEVISKADGHEAIKASIKQLETEMAIALKAPEETRRNIVNRILDRPIDEAHGTPPAGATAPAGKTIARQGTVNSGPNKGKTVIEYSDGTREYR